MKRIITYLFCGILMLSGSGILHAQKINPSVEVTNDMILNTQVASRVTLPINLPDSLYQFRRKFDYSIFSKPYNGSYTFTPYNVKMIPSARVVTENRFYLRAGAGYVLRPELDVVYTPLSSQKAGLSFYEHLSGYAGRYHAMLDNPEFVGREITQIAGVNGYVKLKNTLIEPSFEYRGFYDKNLWADENFHIFQAKARMLRELSTNTLTYKYSMDSELREQFMGLQGSVHPHMHPKYDFSMDYELGCTAYSLDFQKVFYHIKASPKTEFTAAGFDFSLGVNTSFFEKFRLHPAFYASRGLLNGSMKILASLTGEDHRFAYSDLKEQSIDIYEPFSVEVVSKGFYTEKLRAALGLQGKITSFLQYEISAGYSIIEDQPLFRIDVVGEAPDALHVPIMGRNSYNSAWVEGGFEGKIKDISFSAEAVARTQTLDGTHCLTLPAFEANAQVAYSYMGRIKAELYARYVGESHYMDYSLKEYVDLGIRAQYALNSHTAFWLSGGNLLNQQIYTVPLVAAKGVNITAGICLKFR